MNEITIFSNPQFGEIRITISDDNKPMFCLADVCKALELTNPAMVKSRLSAKGISNTDTLTAGGVQSMTYINEANLYKCIFQSRKPEAEKFQDWVYEEVLPTIRKTGGYIVAKADDTPEMIMARAVIVAQATIEKQNKQLAEQSAKIEADAPKVLFADAVAGSSTSCLIGELAKILTQNGYKIEQNRLFEKLRNEGYLGVKGEYYNMPNQRYQEMGLFDVKKRTINNPDGSIIVKTTTKVTGKGQSYFINKFLNR